MVITVLSLPGGVVQAFLCHQTLMRAALGDASVIEIQDLIGTLHRRNAVGNDDLGNIFFLGEMTLDFVFGLHIERRGGIIQYEDRSLFCQGACDGKTLLLAAGKSHAALADDRFVLIRKMVDELGSTCSGDSVMYLFGFHRAAAAEADILRNRV